MPRKVTKLLHKMDKNGLLVSHYVCDVIVFVSSTNQRNPACLTIDIMYITWIHSIFIWEDVEPHAVENQELAGRTR